MSWRTDRTDVDLHVTDPSGEEALYFHPDTKIGGHLTADVTTGFGPEMFVLEKAIPGAYEARGRRCSRSRRCGGEGGDGEDRNRSRRRDLRLEPAAVA
jgi:hypothetical protein